MARLPGIKGRLINRHSSIDMPVDSPRMVIDPKTKRPAEAGFYSVRERPVKESVVTKAAEIAGVAEENNAEKRRAKFDAMSAKDLKKYAKDKDLDFDGRMSKAKLIDLMVENEID